MRLRLVSLASIRSSVPSPFRCVVYACSQPCPYCSHSRPPFRRSSLAVCTQHQTHRHRQVFISLRRLPPVASSRFNLPFLTITITILLSISFPFSAPCPSPTPIHHVPTERRLKKKTPSPARIRDHHVVPTCKDLLIISSLKTQASPVATTNTTTHSSPTSPTHQSFPLFALAL